MWFIYILKCSDNSLYTGITTDLSRRIIEHNSTDKWAKYTKMRRPVEMIFSHQCSDRSHASKLEIKIKKLSKKQKEKLIETKILPEL